MEATTHPSSIRRILRKFSQCSTTSTTHPTKMPMYPTSATPRKRKIANAYSLFELEAYTLLLPIRWL